MEQLAEVWVAKPGRIELDEECHYAEIEYADDFGTQVDFVMLSKPPGWVEIYSNLDYARSITVEDYVRLVNSK